MAAEFRFWSATLADPAEETEFRTAQAASLRRGVLLASAIALVPYLIGVIPDPLEVLRSPDLWLSDITRALVILVSAWVLIDTLAHREREPRAWRLGLLWVVMATDASCGNLLDPLNAFDGYGGALTLLWMVGATGFSAISPVDFRWTFGSVAAGALIYAAHTVFGQTGGDALERASFALLMVSAAVIVLAIGHTIRRSARQTHIARAAAERANAVKSVFVATMSHEFRTPLNAILGMAELLAETRLDRRQRQFVDLLGTAAEHLGGLLGDILDFSRIETDRITLDAVPFDPGEIIHEVIELLGSEARAKGLSLDAVLFGDAPRWCRGDPLRLRQVVLNLVGNALRHTPRGGVTVRLEAPSGDAGTLLVTVEDTGPGVPAAARASIFEPFVQADPIGGGRQGGLGLGLAISRRLVELMGGRLWLEDGDGGGSRFRFTAAPPVLERPPERVPEPARRPEPLDAAAPPAPRLLLADDSEMNRLVVIEHLRTLPVVVDTAADGAEALARFETGGYAAALLDIQMPVLDGRAAARAMRRLEADKGWPPVPIIALTAGVLWEDREAALAAGCTGFLAKPVKRGVLLRVLSEHLPGLGAVLSAPAPTAPEADGAPLVARFLAEAPVALARLRDAARRDDRAELARLAHTLRGTALIVGLAAVADRVGRLEAAAPAGAPAALDELQAVIDGLAEGWAVRSRPTGPEAEPLPPPPVLAEAAPIRVLLAEDHALVRDGVRGLLAGDARIQVVAEAGDGMACVREACRLRPEMVIIDLMMPRMAGADAIAEIKRRRPEIKLLVLTSVTAPEPILAALRAGADGVLHKGAARTDLFAAIAAVRAGTLYLSPGLPLSADGRDGAAASTLALSLRERQVLKLLVEGRRNREIGELLAISSKTVEKHRASLMKKLGADSASGLAALALRHGLIEAAPSPDTAAGEEWVEEDQHAMPPALCQ